MEHFIAFGIRLCCGLPHFGILNVSYQVFAWEKVSWWSNESGVISTSNNHKHWTTYGKIGHQNLGPGPEAIKLFSCSTQLSMKFQLLINAKILKIMIFLAVKNS